MATNASTPNDADAGGEPRTPVAASTPTLSCPRCDQELEQYQRSETVSSYRCPTESCKPGSLWWRLKNWLATKTPGMRSY